MLKHLKETETLVKKILSENPDARGSSKQLYLEVCKECGLNLTEQQKQIFLKMPDFETITRSARYLKQTYSWLRDKNHQNRLFKQVEMKKYYSKKNKK